MTPARSHQLWVVRLGGGTGVLYVSPPGIRTVLKLATFFADSGVQASIQLNIRKAGGVTDSPIFMTVLTGIAGGKVFDQTPSEYFAIVEPGDSFTATGAPTFAGWGTGHGFVLSI